MKLTAKDSVRPLSSNNVSALATSAERANPGGGLPQESNHRSASDIVVRDVIRGLYEERYEPGQRLVEAELTETYRMSRGSIREALNRLAATGVVELTPQRGAKIRVLMIDEAIDILVIVEGLVGIAARLAALRINRPGAREKLSVALKSLTDFEPSSRTAEYAIARDTFYAALTSIANNAELSRILPTVRIHLIRVQFRAVMRSADRRRHADYLRITEAVLSGDPVAAEAGARAHMRRLIKVLSSFRDANRS